VLSSAVFHAAAAHSARGSRSRGSTGLPTQTDALRPKTKPLPQAGSPALGKEAAPAFIHAAQAA